MPMYILASSEACFFFSSRRRHTRCYRDWSSDVCSSDLGHTLVLCRVGAGRDRYSVVCGAPNARRGVRAAFAPPGAVLPGGRRIAAAKIHGVESQGMLCSERELGLGEEHEAGILLLDGAPPGADLIATLGL